MSSASVAGIGMILLLLGAWLFMSNTPGTSGKAHAFSFLTFPLGKRRVGQVMGGMLVLIFVIIFLMTQK